MAVYYFALLLLAVNDSVEKEYRYAKFPNFLRGLLTY